MTHIIEKMKLPAMIAVFGFMLVAIQVSPTAGSAGFGVANAFAGDKKDGGDDNEGKSKYSSSAKLGVASLVCDCTTVATLADKASKAKDDYEKASKAKDDADKAKSDHDNNGHGNNIDGVDSSNPGKSKEGLDSDPSYDDEKWKSENDDLKNKADKAKDDADKSKASKDKADKDYSDAQQAVVGAPCNCGDGTTGFWADSAGTSTPPAGDAPKAMRQILGQ